MTNNWIEMDPSYEQRLLHVQNGQHSSQGQVCLQLFLLLLV